MISPRHLQRFRRSYHDQRGLRSPLDTLAQEHFVAPCTLDQGLSRPLDPRPVFGTGFDQKETSLSLWKPIDQHLCDCWTREEGGRKFGTLRAYGDGMNRKQKREAPISYRPPIGLRAEFETRLQGSGLSTNAFITAAIFGEAAPRPRRATMLERQMIGQLLSQAARIHDRLLSAASSSSGVTHTAAIEDCRAELVEIRSCLLRALGKGP